VSVNRSELCLRSIVARQCGGVSVHLLVANFDSVDVYQTKLERVAEQTLIVAVDLLQFGASDRTLRQHQLRTVGGQSSSGNHAFIPTPCLRVFPAIGPLDPDQFTG